MGGLGTTQLAVSKLTPDGAAILSVYDKTGLLDLAKGLIKNNIRLLASGGTAKLIREAGFSVEYVANQLTQL